MRQITRALEMFSLIAKRYMRFHKNEYAPSILRAMAYPEKDKPLGLEDLSPRISEGDLNKLHEMFAKNLPTKGMFLESLYKKYHVNHVTHAIAIRDGMIEEK